MTGIGASQMEKDLSRLLNSICGSGLNYFLCRVTTAIIKGLISIHVHVLYE